MQVSTQTKKAFCPDCEMQVKVGPNPKKGQKLMCPHCEAYLEVVSLSPLELDWDMDSDDGDWDSDTDDWDLDGD